MNTGNFRKSLFGGFNRNDVSKYIVKLAAERNEYKERAEKAEELLAAAEAATHSEEAAEDICEEIGTPTEAEMSAKEPLAEEEIPTKAETYEETEEAPAEEDTFVEMESVVREIVENVSDIQMEKAIQEIVENVNAIQSEINEREKQGATACKEDIGDSINRVLGMLESTEAQFGLLVKTLKEIKSDVRG